MNRQLELIHRAYADPISRLDQITRWPPVDAPCPLDADPCEFPYCCCYRGTTEGEE